MEKSFTPNYSPDNFLKHLENNQQMVKAPPELVDNIMAYVRSTKNIGTKLIGIVQLYLN